jgi:hypothetical protein
MGMYPRGMWEGMSTKSLRGDLSPEWDIEEGWS